MALSAAFQDCSDGICRAMEQIVATPELENPACRPLFPHSAMPFTRPRASAFENYRCQKQSWPKNRWGSTLLCGFMKDRVGRLQRTDRPPARARESIRFAPANLRVATCRLPV
jgi:hypothetical protein